MASKPRCSNMLAASTAPLRAAAVTTGERKSPWENSLVTPRDAPTSFSSPGVVSLAAHLDIHSADPQIYPPIGARPPPGFLIREPTIISAPTSDGSIVSTNSP